MRLKSLIQGQIQVQNHSLTYNYVLMLLIYGDAKKTKTLLRICGYSLDDCWRAKKPGFSIQYEVSD